MRWTDVPAPRRRTLLQWHDAMSVHDDAPAAMATWAALAARAAAMDPAAGPLVVVDAKAVKDAMDNVGANGLERGGLLLGDAMHAHDGDERFALVHVRASVASSDDEATGWSLRMQSAVWDAARRTLREGELVVGWYHSHPGIGAFFSDTDRSTQAGFFNQPFSLGWVIDPLRREHAWFVGRGSRALPGASIVVLPAPTPVGS